MSAPALGAREISKSLDEVWPGITHSIVIEEVGARTARVRFKVEPRDLRPGGIVSGPVLMSLADTTVWVAVLGAIGPVAMAVTSDLTIHFLRPTRPGDVLGEARLVKLGRRLAVGDVLIYADGDPDPVAHAVVTYAIPPDADAQERRT